MIGFFDLRLTTPIVDQDLCYVHIFFNVNDRLSSLSLYSRSSWTTERIA